MNKRLKNYLIACGLDAGATDEQALAFMKGLTGRKAARARELAELSGDEAAQAQQVAEQAEATAAAARELANQAAEEPAEEPEPEPAETGRQTAPKTAARIATPVAGGVGGAGGSPVPTPAPDLESVRREGVEAERRRGRELRALAGRLGLGEAWAEQMIHGGFSLDQAKEAALDKIAASHAPVHLAVGTDHNRDTIADAVADAVLDRAGFRMLEMDADGDLKRDAAGRAVERTPHPRAKAFRRQRLVNIARGFLQAMGQTVEGLSDAQVARLAMRPSPMGVHSTGDFPNILANALNKTLRAEYQEYPQQWMKWCSRNTAPDFKEIKRTQLGEVPNLLAVNEGGEYKEVTIGDAKEVYSLVKYGRSFKQTWEAIINDDLNAFTRLPRQMYRAAIRLEDVVALAILTANANMSDGAALFVAGHGNLAAGTGIVGAPSVTTLNYMLSAFRTQTGQSADAYLNLVPRFIIAPAALEATIAELLQSTVKVGASNATKNIWEGRLEPIIHPVLDANSTTAWYGAADPADIDTVEVCFLEGYEQPTIEQMDITNPDERRYTVRHVVAAKAIDWRGLYSNPGA